LKQIVEIARDRSRYE